MIQEATSVHPSGDQRPRPLPGIWEDGAVGQHAEITSATKEAGAAVGIQLNHTGAHNAYYGDIPMTNMRDYPTMSASDTQEPKHMGQGKRMTETDIRNIIQAFGDGAARAEQAGYDLLEIQAGHGYLVGQFLSPLYNKRTDKWGGDWKNRTRFFLEVAKEIRSRVSDELAVTARFTYNELYSGGLNAPEDDEPVKMMAHVDDYIDFWDIDIGNYESHSDIIAPAYSQEWGEHYQLNAMTPAVAALMREHGIETPIGGCGRVRDPEKARQSLEETEVDMIGMVRQSIADPAWPNKVKIGNDDDIRECIGCNTCIASFGNFKPIMCVQNPSVAQEYRGYHTGEYEQTADPADILVIGGGPCGLEFAMVAGRRGHDVEIHDANRELGGHTRHVVAQLPGRDEWEKVIDYRESALENLSNVTIRRESKLELADIRERGPEEVVFATGAEWDVRGMNPMTKEPLPGWNQDHVIVPETVMKDPDSVGERVLIVDADAHMVGPGLAEFLGNKGHDVTLMGYPSAIGENQALKLEKQEMLKRLHQAGVTLTNNKFPTELTDTGATYIDIYTQEGPMHHECDTIVLTTKRKSRTDLYDAFEGSDAAGNGHLTGEAVTPKTFFSVANPLWWAHKLGRSI